MKLTPFQLGIIAIGGFATVVMLNILSKYQSNEDFRDQLKEMKPADLVSFRTRRFAEERMEPVGGGQDFFEQNSESEFDDNENE